MKRKYPTKVGDVLTDLKQVTPLGKQLELAQIWERWPELAGPHLCDHGRPETVKGNVLHIEADSPVWMHKFAYRKWDLIKRINRMAGCELVSDIFVALRPDAEDGPRGM